LLKQKLLLLQKKLLKLKLNLEFISEETKVQFPGWGLHLFFLPIQLFIYLQVPHKQRQISAYQ
ncbi:MAG: hypothetical protein Q4G23_09030, partial [Clostridia bacterium]|nr:hypothetical protein [Clostridia bacterium]